MLFLLIDVFSCENLIGLNGIFKKVIVPLGFNKHKFLDRVTSFTGGCDRQWAGHKAVTCAVVLHLSIKERPLGQVRVIFYFSHSSFKLLKGF